MFALFEVVCSHQSENRDHLFPVVDPDRNIAQHLRRNGLFDVHSILRVARGTVLEEMAEAGIGLQACQQG